MTIEPFREEDFDVFQIDGLEARMNGIKETIRPKLTKIGDTFAPVLSTLTGDEMFPHVAKHARRSVNPPDDTWVAFATSKRGYKKLPHFQVGLWQTHVFIWFGVIYECPDKRNFALQIEQHRIETRKGIPDHFVWSTDHTKPRAVVDGQLDDDAFEQMIKRLKTVKKAELLCGIHLPKEKAVTMSGNQLSETIENTFETLVPLYKLATKK